MLIDRGALERWLRDMVAYRKGMTDGGALDSWSLRELGPLGLTVAERLARGAVLRARMGHASGPVFCERGVRVTYPQYLSAGRDFSLEQGCQIIGFSRRGIVFGNRCTVGRYALIRPTNALGGEPGEGLAVGDHSNIGHFAFVGCSGLIEIGSKVLMGPRVTLLAENHEHARTDIPIKDQGVSRSFIKIEDDCWLGAGSTVLAGVTIGRGSIVAAGSVVTRDVPSFSIVAGVPAEVVRDRASEAKGAQELPA